MAMKRSREAGGEIESMVMAKCLMLLSRGLDTTTPSTTNRFFECTTCNRRFSSFQALGGHRASHKRTKLMEENSNEDVAKFHSKEMKPKNPHGCSVCGLKFSTGQALGGHMRRHRVAMSESDDSLVSSSLPPVVVSEVAPVVMKRSNSRRVMCLDLNLTPLENDLKLLFGKLAPKVDCSI
ncbi:hypothetical protein L1049_007807 [Liquidambar formosana]|uniref:C2H2-type domain-containing protein n=1 Tax=Liquidambar formosana TaxID=63359 RepID=A0AAP0S4Z3_LIQFO